MGRKAIRSSRGGVGSRQTKRRLNAKTCLAGGHVRRTREINGGVEPLYQRKKFNPPFGPPSGALRVLSTMRNCTAMPRSRLIKQRPRHEAKEYGAAVQPLSLQGTGSGQLRISRLGDDYLAVECGPVALPLAFGRGGSNDNAMDAHVCRPKRWGIKKQSLVSCRASGQCGVWRWYIGGQPFFGSRCY